MQTHDISEEEVKKFKNLLEHLKQIAEDGVTPLIEKYILSMLDYALPFFSHLVLEDDFYELHRLTINKKVIGKNKRIHDIKFLKYPPSENVVNYGRCNYPKQSIFYGSFFHMTAINEMKPRIGDLVTFSVWRAKTGTTLKYCPIFKNQPPMFKNPDPNKRTINPRTFKINELYEEKIKDYPTYMRQQIDELVQFVADAFTKSVNPKNSLDYIFSAYFSNKIFNEFEKGNIEAIYYPSVQDKLSFENVSIKPDVLEKKYDLVEVRDDVINNDPSTGCPGYWMDGLSTCKSFDYAKGKILWDPNKIHQPNEKMLDFKLRYGIDMSD